MFDERIKELRKRDRITQVELAEAMELSKGTVAMWEVGQREANFQTLQKLADYFKVSIDYLLGYSDDPSSSAHDQEEVESMLGPSQQKMKQAVEDLYKLDEFGAKAVIQLIGTEYKRCLEQGIIQKD